MAAALDTLVDALNATGVALLTVLEPVPVDIVMCVFVSLAGLVWYENLRAYCRLRKARRVEREQKQD